MAVMTANGIPVSSCELSQSLTGRARADVRLGDTTGIAVGAAVTLEFESGETVAMTVQRSGLEAGFPNLALVGGAGKLGALLPAKHYQGAPLAIIIADIVRESGEELGDVDAPNTMPHWLRARARAWESLASAVSRAPNRNWRINRAGKLWVGADSYAAHPRTLEVIRAMPEEAHFILEPDWSLEAGRVVTVDNAGLTQAVRAERVMHVVGKRLETHVWQAAA